jgi:hypothetical protein
MLISLEDKCFYTSQQAMGKKYKFMSAVALKQR